jgi:putative transposase
MPRPTRQFSVGEVYHVLNRGNHRADLFHKPEDFAAFLRVLCEGLERYPVDLLSWCLMTNHWHLVLRPRKREAISDLMRWVGVTHVRRHHEHYQTRGGGHLYQGRFKSFPVEDDGHFLTVCRYVEANPLRASMVKRAEDWRWSRLGFQPTADLAPPQASWPVDRPANWAHLVNQAQPQREVEQLKVCISRGQPFGSKQWILATAKRLRLTNTLNKTGRPKKNQ